MSGPSVPPAGDDRNAAERAEDEQPEKVRPEDMPPEDSALDSIGKAITSPVRSAADPEEPKPGKAPPAPG